ncbi:protein-L-isoaspartate(D-aspartate) O-methyltransferase [Helicobacter bizzozeronii]|uniref:protein-L-isoaspartate(D-aspartate) O-methyltransferase n=1 Tax=Helicobacter bizzozeronii TaxID=56877 RepID=UPI000CF01928|nr:protein-L-isoaspartate(D-aspartate) O-methyltransferase [Helicobacter bizzozeronii]
MFQIKNAHMCEAIAQHFNLEESIKNAICAINREEFVPSKQLAYSLDALPMGADQFISSPLTVAKMTQFLKPQGADSVLEIGCGSGYQAMVLSKLFRRVFSIERIEKLLVEAKKRFRKLGATNIHTRLGDGQLGWSEYGPYDRILFSACTHSIPAALSDQLEERGILVAPILDNQAQKITRFIKKGGVLVVDQVLDRCLFVPILDGIERGI